MSLAGMMWGAKDAPAANVEERAILVIMGDEVDGSGCGCWLSEDTIAERALLSPRTVRRRLADMEERGLIALGDQRLVQHIRSDRRPKVRDLMIPYSWFPNVENVNKERLGKQMDALRPEDRPDLPPAEAPKRRADVGKPKPRRQNDGETASPLANRDEGTSSHPINSDTGGLVDRDGGTASSQRGVSESPNPVIDPLTTNPGSVPASQVRRGKASPKSSTTAEQPPLSEDLPDPAETEQAKAKALNDLATGTGREWLAKRESFGCPLVWRGTGDPIVVLRNMLLPALKAGYSETDVKRALMWADRSVPTPDRFEAGLVQVRQNGWRPAKDWKPGAAQTRQMRPGDRGFGRDVNAHWGRQDGAEGTERDLVGVGATPTVNPSAPVQTEGAAW
ncbi:hypothetical protein [Actinoplanes sp. URMC 104]|uniref:hypothetical protein n=1 Tax=Actinoplanes sp. URMC 104 TaxID=3423409 RepID=UPI003F1C6969